MRFFLPFKVTLDINVKVARKKLQSLEKLDPSLFAIWQCESFQAIRVAPFVAFVTKKVVENVVAVKVWFPPLLVVGHNTVGAQSPETDNFVIKSHKSCHRRSLAFEEGNILDRFQRS